jgi:hypothetical protein
MVLSATKANHVILAVPPSFAFGDALAANWADLSRNLPFLRNVANSVGISVIYTLVATLVCAMGGYALAKFTFAGRAAIFTLILVALTIPFEVRIIPQYILIARDLGLTNTWWAIILPGLANALGMFFMRQNMLSVPSELLEAARIDGASEWRIFYAVVLPIMQPALAAVGILLLPLPVERLPVAAAGPHEPRRLHDPGRARDAGGAHARVVGRHHGGHRDRHRPVPDHVPLPPALLRRRHHRRRGEGLTHDATTRSPRSSASATTPSTGPSRPGPRTPPA